ncbi:MAG TPA: hypothetical protein PLY87_11655 [Planctomycetaceae bacterium]|nr:hypothetical protein [Planctomycetaceae bacterium]HQZ65728.1 hypothetical protein [Planctomycetaceae bacterium]
MSLKQWENNGWIRPHQTSPQEFEKQLRAEVIAWLRENHAKLLPVPGK